MALGDSSPSINSQTRSDIAPVAPVIKQFSIKGITNTHQKKYTCLARNTIIKDGVKTKIIDTATIKVEVLGQLLVVLFKQMLSFLALQIILLDELTSMIFPHSTCTILR